MSTSFVDCKTPASASPAVIGITTGAVDRPVFDTKIFVVTTVSELYGERPAPVVMPITAGDALAGVLQSTNDVLVTATIEVYLGYCQYT
jgi:hypothetical protein